MDLHEMECEDVDWIHLAGQSLEAYWSSSYVGLCMGYVHI